MPELPEVETIVRQLGKVLPGRVVAEVEVLREKSAQSQLGELVGKEILGVSRMAKNIVIRVGGRSGGKADAHKTLKKSKGMEELYLLVHLKMTGQLIFDENFQFSNSNLHTKFNSQNSTQKLTKRVVGGHPTRDWVGELPSGHTRIVMGFTDGSKLFFNDQRVFGWWKVLDGDKLQETRHKLPPDVVDEEFSVEYLRKVLSSSTRAVKLVILDQAKMGGMGNIYANDALWSVGIHPCKPAKKLTRKEVEVLHGAMVKVLEKGIALGGASYSHYVDTEGLGGKYQEHFLVYDKEGEKCARCGTKIEKLRVGARGTYFCPRCQV